MKRTLDFNSIDLPRLELIFRDEARTRVTVMAPTLEMVEEIQANSSALKAALGGEQNGSLVAVYDMVAKFISRNEEGITVTGAELRDRYGWDDLGYLVIFIQAYIALIDEIKSAKN